MIFPEQPFGFVAGRWVRSIGETPDDPDRAPDYVPVKDGTVTFTPQVTNRVAADGPGWSWPSHYIEVKPEHTVFAPLWLPPIAPPAKGPLIENRVVTIPDGGTDGQVLVWDGAGFSWDFPPTGPEGPQGEQGPQGVQGEVGPQGEQGPKGEVTTAAFTTALAGKVTGAGMSIRLDTSVGTRVLLDHPGGTTMLMGDTGWRDMSSYLPPGITGTFLARRTTHATDVKISVTLTADSPLIGSRKAPLTNLIPGLPNRMFPHDSGHIASLIMREGSSGAPTGTVAVGFQSLTESRLRVTSSSGGTWEAGDNIRISGTIPNDQPWLDAQFGTPA